MSERKQIMVGDRWVDKWHVSPLGVEVGDEIKFTFNKTKSHSLTTKTGEVTSTREDTVAFVDVDGAGKWVLKHGAVLVVQSGRKNRHHGTLTDITTASNDE